MTIEESLARVQIESPHHGPIVAAEVAALTRALAESREALGYYKANGQWEWYMCRFENGEHSLKWHFTTPQAKGSFPSDVADKALTTPPQQER